MSGPNWGRLFRQGRCKAIGVPWNDKELHARYTLEIPAEYVRAGCLDVESYEKAKAKDEKDGLPLDRMGTRELFDKAHELGLNVTPQATDEALRMMIRSAVPNGGLSAKEVEANATTAKKTADAKAKTAAKAMKK